MKKKYYWIFAVLGLVFLSGFILKPLYGAEKPTVNTAQIHISESTATLSGSLKDTGGKKISQYGFRWGTSPVLLEAKESFASGIEAGASFQKTIDGLEAGGTYYYQAYAVNSKGCGYGEVKSFTAPEKPNNPPVVSVSGIENNARITRGDAVKITAAATDDNQVREMSLYVNGRLETETGNGSLIYNWETSGVEPGNYTVKVVASDGDKSASKDIVLRVEEKLQQQAASLPAAQVNEPAAKPVVTKTVATKDYNSSQTTVSRGSDPPSSGSTYNKLGKVQGSYGQFHYKDTGGGRIEIDPAWIAENIVTITLPGLNRKVQVHKDAADNFIQAFNYIKNGTAVVNGREVSLLSLVKSMDGTFVSRHVNWNPSRGLSNHSWGIAIDINAGDHFRYVNPAREPNDPNLILWEKAFKPAGFSWGNSYSDSMHYELLD